MAARLVAARFILVALLLAAAVPSLCMDFTPGFEMNEAAVHGEQSSKKCDMDFSKVKFDEVTNVCKGPNYDQEPCCSAFKKMACKYRTQVNDFSSTCPVEFIAYLNYAGAYPNGVFVGRCTSGTDLCSS